MNVYHSYRDLVKVRYTNRQLGNNETHFIASRAAVVRLFFFHSKQVLEIEES